MFNKKEAKYKNGSRSNKASGCGYWKATGLDKKIITNSRKKHDEIMGMRKTFVFYKGKVVSNGCRTNWIMHEYRLLHSQNADYSSQVCSNIYIHAFNFHN